ncbi:MAG: alpha/beta hydrolase fold domain-containing protein [Actinomycetota bacterium]
MRRTVLASSRLVAIALAVTALAGCRIILAPDRPAGGVDVGAGPSGAPPTVDVPYGPRLDQLLDLYLPDPATFSGPRPVIVWMHAGGFTSGSRKDPMPVAQYEVRRGYAVASVEYGLEPAHFFPTSVEDVKLAIRWLKHHAHDYGLDPARVIVAGYSAGAELAALVAVTPGQFTPPVIPDALVPYDDTVAGAFMISGGYDFVRLARSTNWWARMVAEDYLGCTDPGPVDLPLSCPPGRADAATVRNHLKGAAPPAFFVHGSNDPLFPPFEQQIPLAIEWAKAKGGSDAVWAQLAPESGHGIEIDAINLPMLDEFLDGVVTGRVR